MVMLGLKASADPTQLATRLQYHPEVFEFYTDETDFTPSGLRRLAAAVKEVKATSTDKIILHHPMSYQGEHLEMIAPAGYQPEIAEFLWRSTNELLQIAFDEDIQVLVHGSYGKETHKVLQEYPNLAAAEEVLYHKLDQFSALGQEHLMFENSTSPLFYYGNPELDQFIYEQGYRLAFDTSHVVIKAHGATEPLLKSLARLREHIVHYHLVDTMGQKHDSLQLGTGVIPWKQVLPLLNPKATNIYEIDVKDLNNPKEQLASHEYLQKLIS